jgi:uncharacterized protein DUF3857/transglutaminase superfamily protein
MGRGWRHLFTAGAFVALAFQGPAGLAKDKAPDWLTQAAALKVPPYEKDTPAVVLLDEQRDEVDEDGHLHSVHRFAVRLLTREGRSAAVAYETYQKDTDKVHSLDAWLIRPSGEVHEYGKDEVADLALGGKAVYDEARARMVSAAEAADAGAVFGYESETESRSVFTQVDRMFQDELPVLLSRYTLQLPEGWRAEGVTFNHAPVAPAVSGSASTWELRDLPPNPMEPSGPPTTSLSPRLAVSWFPPQGKKLEARSFQSWAEVSSWVSELSDPQAVPDASITAKAKALTADARTELERIEAIASFVQGVQYISVQIGVGRGGGIRPHAARDVLAKGYGDCKDKANLMRSLLQAVGITAYPVSIFSGDRGYVRREWPSPQQFNHCIIAVKVGEKTEAPTVLVHPALGRLLIFDPTDDQTPVGGLPEYEQGSLALVVAGASGELLAMPSLGPESNRLERRIEAILAPDGSVSASLRESSSGQVAADERSFCQSLPALEYAKRIEGWISRGVTGAKLSRIEPGPQASGGRFELSVAFSAPRYAQLMQGGLLVFKPVPVPPRRLPSLTDPKRRHPVVLPSEAVAETVQVQLPAGFSVDELPDPAKLEADFGTFTSSCEAKDGSVVCKRDLLLRPVSVPADQYGAVRHFFEQVRAAQEAPVVLARGVH